MQKMRRGAVIHLTWVQRLMTEDKWGELVGQWETRPPGGGIHVLWLLGPCSPSAPLCWVFPHASEFHRGTVSPMTARTQIFLDLINTLKIQ